MLTTLKELRDHCASRVRETQLSTLIDQFINLTLIEIWSEHPWTFSRRKTTFVTVASQEDYVLDEEVDTIALLRQRSSPQKLIYLPDPAFYRQVPNPEDVGTGTPSLYRLWEETGFSAQPTSAEKVTVVSSSASDGSSFKVVLVGRESTNNLVVSEEVTLNGTTSVLSTKTYAIAGLLQASKSAQTTGTLTIAGNTSATTFGRIAPEEAAPRYKRISLYPIPSAVITLYLEYYERLRKLVNDADVPQLDHKWIGVVIDGVLLRLWEYKQNETAAGKAETRYRVGVAKMKAQDLRNVDYVPVVRPRQMVRGVVRRVSDSVSNGFPSYSVGV